MTEMTQTPETTNTTKRPRLSLDKYIEIHQGCTYYEECSEKTGLSVNSVKTKQSQLRSLQVPQTNAVDENGNTIYLKDENGNLVLRSGNKVPKRVSKYTQEEVKSFVEKALKSDDFVGELAKHGIRPPLPIKKLKSREPEVNLDDYYTILARNANMTVEELRAESQKLMATLVE